MDAMDASLTNPLTRTDIPQSLHDKLNAYAEWIAKDVEPCAGLLHCILLLSREVYAATKWPMKSLDVNDCAELLDSNHQLRDLLREAIASGDYTQIRKRPEFHSIDDEAVLQEAALFVKSHLTKAEPPIFGPVTPRLTEYGTLPEDRIVEPPAFPSLLKWFENEPRLNLSGDAPSQPAAQSSRGQELVVLYLLRVLRYPVPFSTIFTFYGTPPQWARELAQIVECFSGAALTVDASGNQNPGLGVVHYAAGIEDVLAWIENPTTTPPVLVPSAGFGPGLMIRSGDVLLMGQIKSYMEGDSYDLISLHPDYWFKESPPNLRLKLVHAIERHRVLRFVGGYPVSPDFDESFCNAVAALGPDIMVATITMDNFRAQFISEDQVDVLEAVVHALTQQAESR